MSRLRLLLLPPTAALVVTALGLQIQEALWRRHATPEQLIDDAADALLGPWPLVLAGAVALVLMQTLVVGPLIQRAARRPGAGRSGAVRIAAGLAIAATALAAAAFHSSVDAWPATFAAASLMAGLPTLVLGLVSARLLSGSRSGLTTR